MGVLPTSLGAPAQAAKLLALRAGADLLVIGRPITDAPDPGAAAAAIGASLRKVAVALG